MEKTVTANRLRIGDEFPGFYFAAGTFASRHYSFYLRLSRFLLSSRWTAFLVSRDSVLHLVKYLQYRR